MRIVHVITRLISGGAEENTIATCNAQLARGHRVWLVHGRDAAPETRAQLAPGVEVVRVPAMIREVSLSADIAALWSLRRLFHQLDAEVVHTHNSKAGFLGRAAARLAGVPVIIHGVHILPFLAVDRRQRALYLAMERMVAPATDAFIAVSQGMRDANLAAGLGRAETNYVVHSGMDLARFRQARPMKLGWRGRTIAVVAAFEARKRHMAFLEVFARLARRHGDLNLALLGEGLLEVELRARAAALGIADRVHFLGFRPDVERWIAAADICALPSMREGLPRVVVQYAACGRPAVVTALPGLEEIVEDGRTGFVVGSGRVEDMEAPLDRLLSEPALAAAMAAAAARRDLSCWDVEAMEPRIEAIIRPIAAAKGLAALRLASTGTA